MPSMVNFGDWLQAQGPEYITNPKKIRSAAQKTRYFWVLTTRGKPMDSYIRVSGGLDVREKVMLVDQATFQTYTPNDTLSTPMSQVMTTLFQPMSYAHDKMVWTKNEAIQNGQSSAYTDTARVQMYVNFHEKLEVALQVSIANGMEGKFASTKPNGATMEGAGATEPPCLYALINEFPNSLYVESSVSYGTKHGINPAAAGKTTFRNHVFGYDSALVNPTGGAKNLFNALDSAANRLVYDSPGSVGFGRSDQNWESGNWNNKCCAWSYTGLEKLMDLARQRNTTWTRTNDIGMEVPVYRGIEQYSIPALETIAIYPATGQTHANNAGPVTEGGAGIGIGPRGYILDTTAVHTIFNKDVMFDRTETRQLDNQPFTNVIWMDVYYTYMITAPWLTGVIAPGAVSGVFPDLTYTPSAVVYASY